MLKPSALNDFTAHLRTRLVRNAKPRLVRVSTAKWATEERARYREDVPNELRFGPRTSDGSTTVPPEHLAADLEWKAKVDLRSLPRAEWLTEHEELQAVSAAAVPMLQRLQRIHRSAKKVERRKKPAEDRAKVHRSGDDRIGVILRTWGIGGRVCPLVLKAIAAPADYSTEALRFAAACLAQGMELLTMDHPCAQVAYDLRVLATAQHRVLSVLLSSEFSAIGHL